MESFYRLQGLDSVNNHTFLGIFILSLFSYSILYGWIRSDW